MNKSKNTVILDRKIEALSTFIDAVLEKEDISFKDLIGQLKEKHADKPIIKIPCSIFRQRKLGVLEALTKYLVENLRLKYSEIAKLLNRDARPIWVSYHNAKKKVKKQFLIDSKSVMIPIYIFSNRKIGALESLVKYLKEDLKLKNSQIAIMLARDNRTIWASYNKAKLKLKNE